MPRVCATAVDAALGARIASLMLALNLRTLLTALALAPSSCVSPVTSSCSAGATPLQPSKDSIERGFFFERKLRLEERDVPLELLEGREPPSLGVPGVAGVWGVDAKLTVGPERELRAGDCPLGASVAATFSSLRESTCAKSGSESEKRAGFLLDETCIGPSSSEVAGEIRLAAPVVVGLLPVKASAKSSSTTGAHSGPAMPDTP